MLETRTLLLHRRKVRLQARLVALPLLLLRAELRRFIAQFRLSALVGDDIFKRLMLAWPHSTHLAPLLLRLDKLQLELIDLALETADLALLQAVRFVRNPHLF